MDQPVFSLVVVLAIATLIYLLVDIYRAVRSFQGILRCQQFWLLWHVFLLLNLIAWGALQVALNSKAKELVGREDLAALLIVVLSTLGTVTVIQSFTLKAADLKLVDIGPIIEKYRNSVLTDIAEKVREL